VTGNLTDKTDTRIMKVSNAQWSSNRMPATYFSAYDYWPTDNRPVPYQCICTAQYLLLLFPKLLQQYIGN